MSEALSSSKYDVFISYTEANKAWVKGFLLSALDSAEVKYVERENFSLGVPKLKEVERFIQESKYVLLIISDAYFTENFNEFTDILAQSYGIENKIWPVIPLFLEEVQLPPTLKMLTSLDATDESKWQTIVERLCEQVKRPRPEPPPRPECPYPGMKTFNEEDSKNFWGRGNEIDAMVRQLDNYPFLAVIGRSGSGKSSLVFAGLIPKLKNSSLFPGEWIVRTMRPGMKPVTTLREILGGSLDELSTTVKSFLASQPNAQRFLLIVDQFEEVFTIVKDQKILQYFKQVLYQLIQIENCYVVLTIRADFYQDLIGLQPLWNEIKAHRYEVEALTKDGLREAILQPAKNAGVYIDSILVERLVEDFSGAKEPGILAFFQETLRSLWDKLAYKYLPLHAYEEKSQLEAIIADFANRAWLALNQNRHKVARRIFLRLVQFGEGRPDTRRQQFVSDLQKGNNPEEFRIVLNHFINDKYRLLTISGEENESYQIVDLAHEILISSWPRFQEWINQRREAEKERRWLEEKAQEWVKQGQRISGLLNSDNLKKAKKWIKTPDADDLGYSKNLITLIQHSQLLIWSMRFIFSGLTTGLIITGIITWLAQQQAARDQLIRDAVLKITTPDLVRQLSQRLPSFVKIAEKAKNSRNFEKALANYQFLVGLKQMENQIKYSPNSDSLSELKSEREQIQRVAEQAEESLAEVISLSQIPRLEEQLKAGDFGVQKLSGSEIEGDYFSPAAQEQQFTGALQTTYMILMGKNGANADRNQDGLFTDGEEELIPCATLEELEQLWRKYTQYRCGWYGENSDREAQDCQELEYKTLTIMLFYGVLNPEFNKRLNTQCQVVKLLEIETEIAQ
ncbi:TIR domain-containing protein [Okeania sp. SIO2B3]|uniref:nSTAND1 domain-containing NTPase n=1 Tax=Okeania sp. SIO2B3 TaxID=2607784 RepID=UPI0013C275D3|nr:TIR domain-containing protein [Okeania sp. SIO2B3]NET46430.1 TIR domain-containing protein [Okeania sp. SIO2B3]